MKQSEYKNKAFIVRFQNAFTGITKTFQIEKSFRIQLVFASMALISLVLTGAKLCWWLIFILIIGAILSAELFNSALENALDIIHPEQHPSIKIAKDSAAGAVLILSLTSIILFLIFFVCEVLRFCSIF
jgi:diacylglycerol kinase (ATP)